MAERDDRLEVPRRSRLLFAWFRWYAQRYAAKHFDAVRVLRAPSPARRGDALPEDPGPGPLIVLLNHPSWWDPLVCLVLAGLFPERAPYAPMDASQLERYRFFRKLGFFGVEPGTVRGAAAFLRTSEAILRLPGTALWITAQGRFADPRERPVVLEPGVAHLARRLEAGWIVPLALEYPFWEERFPEALARFGPPIPLESPGRSARAWLRILAEALEGAQDALARAACARDRAAFETVLEGRRGVGGFYDLFRFARAALRGERFRAGHGRAPEGSAGGAAAPREGRP